MHTHPVRILLAIHNVYTDHTSGAQKCLKTLMEWLSEAGHESRVLASARFDGREPEPIDQHLRSLGVPLRQRPPQDAFVKWVKGRGGQARGRKVVDFRLNGVDVATLLTRYNDPQQPNRLEYEQFVFEFDQACATFRPDLVMTQGAHPVCQEIMRRARARGITTVFRLANFGYEDDRLYQDVDHVFTCSPFLSRHYFNRIGLVSTPLTSPIHWDEVLSPPDRRHFLTFINPTIHKGAGLFARLALMLGETRPDIPILVVQSAGDAHLLNSIQGVVFTKYPQIMASPPARRPADIFELTKVLLVPSVFHEPFGRVAAEALINGVPPLVSNRGALPDTVGGGGQVLPLPAWLTETATGLVSPDEARPWFDAVCALWDDPNRYAVASKAALGAGRALYGEDIQRRRYIDYVTGLKPGGRVFVDPPAPPTAEASSA